MAICYDGKNSLLCGHNEDGSAEEFYCGKVLDDLTLDLIAFKRGELTLQQMHTLMLQYSNKNTHVQD